jgi:MFS family permease
LRRGTRRQGRKAREAVQMMTATLLTPRFVLLCVVICLGAHAPNLLVLLPRHLRAIGLAEAEIGIVMGAFPLASIAAMPAIASLSERFGRRAPILAGLVLCGTACAAMALAASLPAFLVARATAGVGWAGVLVGGSILTAEIAPPGRLAQALGVAGVLTLVAMAVGPSLGELLAARVSFDAVFLTAASLCAVGAAGASFLPAGRATTHTTGRGLVLLPELARPLAATFLVSAGFGAVVSFLADATALAGIGSIAGFFNAYVGLAILARLACGSWSDRFGRLRVILPSLAGQALALGAIAFTTRAWQLVPAGALFGFTHGLYYPALMALTVERAPVARRARAIASFNFAFSAGIAVSAVVNGFVAERFGYRAVYLVCGSAALASIALVAGTRTAAEVR